MRLESLDPNTLLRPEAIQYELQRVTAERYFAPEVLSQMHSSITERYLDKQTRMLVQEMVATVATWRQQRMLSVPANWWQHFKQRFFPAWALRRWPVLYTHYDAAVILPKVPVVAGAYHTVEFPVWSRSEDR